MAITQVTERRAPRLDIINKSGSRSFLALWSDESSGMSSRESFPLTTFKDTRSSNTTMISIQNG